MGKYRLADARGRFILRILPVALLLNLALAGPGYAQMGVATGNGVATPAKPLPAGMKPPVVRYEDIAAQAGLTGVNVSGSPANKQYIVETTGTGVAIFDYDNDGYVDLFMTQWGENVLYRNQGNGTFRDETEARGLGSSKTRWSTGCAFVDFNRDGALDLVVVHYIEFDPAKTPHPGEKSQCEWKGLPVICGPRGLPGETISLYQNDGHGHFTDVSDRMHITTPKDYYCFSPLVTDFDNDGWPDIFVACDSTASLYFHNVKGERFEEMGVQAGVAYNEEGREQAGMGTATADFRHSGRFDIFKTNFADDTHTYYRNDGADNFTDATIDTGLAVNTRFLGWGTAAIDFDNDGWKDLILANGHVYPEVDSGHTGEKFKQGRLLYWNRGDGQFFDLSAQAGSGIAAGHSSRGLAVGDLNNDGNEEIAIVNMGEAPSLLKNMAPLLGHSMLIRVLTATNRDAIGARVTVTANGQTQMDEVRSGGTYISQSDFRLHFGLGKATAANLSVRWVDGKVENFTAVGAGQVVTIQEGKGIVKSQPYASGKP